MGLVRRTRPGSPTSQAFVSGLLEDVNARVPITRDVQAGASPSRRVTSTRSPTEASTYPTASSPTTRRARCSTFGSTRPSATSPSHASSRRPRARRRDAWKRLVAGPRHAPPPLHRQGQHPVPLPRLPVSMLHGVGSDAEGRKYVLPWQVPGQRVLQPRRQEVQHVQRLVRFRPRGLLRELRRGGSALLSPRRACPKRRTASGAGRTSRADDERDRWPTRSATSSTRVLRFVGKHFDGCIPPTDERVSPRSTNSPSCS